jgi:hypothetical protein
VMGFDSLQCEIAQDVHKSRRTVSVLCDRTHVYRQMCRWTAERSVNRVFMQVRHFSQQCSGGNWQKPWPVQVVRLAKSMQDAARLERAWSPAGRQN